MGLAHVVFPIILENLKGPFMHGGSARFSPTLLVEVEGSQLIRLFVSHSLASVWMREEEEHTRALASPRRGGAGSGCAASFCYFCTFLFFCYMTMSNTY